MKAPFFYHQELQEQSTIVELNEETSKHCIQVLRMKINEEILLTNGKGLLATTQIISDHKKKTVVKIVSFTHQPMPTKQVSIAISLLKNPTRLEWFLEKAVEIGVTAIYPIICNRTEKQFFKYERMKSIVQSAMLQSQQTYLPELNNPISFVQLLETSLPTEKYIAHCEDNNKSVFSEIKKGNDLMILIGPEGDFTKDEIDLAKEKNFKEISLGNTRLRTETAGIVAAIMAMYGATKS